MLRLKRINFHLSKGVRKNKPYELFYIDRGDVRAKKRNKRDKLHSRITKHMYISHYERSQEYGGAEEGGWYYDAFLHLGSKRVRVVQTSFKTYVLGNDKERCVNYGRYHYEGGEEWRLEDVKGKYETKERPIYC